MSGVLLTTPVIVMVSARGGATRVAIVAVSPMSTVGVRRSKDGGRDGGGSDGGREVGCKSLCL